MDIAKGNRFSDAARREEAAPLVGRFCEALRPEGVPAQTAVFGAPMRASLVNDGPVTIVPDR